RVVTDDGDLRVQLLLRRRDDVLAQVRVGAGDARAQAGLVGPPAHDDGVEVPVRPVGDPEVRAAVAGDRVRVLLQHPRGVVLRLRVEVELVTRAGDPAVDRDGDVVGEAAHGGPFSSGAWTRGCCPTRRGRGHRNTPRPHTRLALPDHRSPGRTGEG